MTLTAKDRTRRSLLRRPVVRGVIAVVAILFVAALALLQPWRLWIDRTVNEPAPGIAAGTGAAQPGPVVLARGSLISHEHSTTGTVQLLRLADGSRVLRLADLDTSDGPLLKVWLSDAPVVSGKAGWHVFDDGRHLSLGKLKGNKGSQNYRVPDTADLGGLRSMSIWCDRFNVSFGAAELVRE